VQGALQTLDVPTKHDIDALSNQVHALAQMATRLSARLEETQSGVKTKAKKKSKHTHT
jgi:hypothetical protein